MQCAVRELHFLRTGTWKCIKTKCRPFLTMDFNAQFSEIFQKIVFCDSAGDIDGRAAISRELVSLFTYEAFCMDCGKHFKADNEVFVNYISLSDLITQSIMSEL